MKPTWEDKASGVKLYRGDANDVMAALPEASVDSIVCDPPYGLEFMGKEWDKLGATVERCSDEQDEFAKQRGGSLPFGGGGKRIRYGSTAASMQAWHLQWSTAALRVAKPGAFLLAFGGSRTSHRLVCAIEDAGWEVRDGAIWLYGQGFAKSLNISKSLDKAAGAEREVVGVSATATGKSQRDGMFSSCPDAADGVSLPITAPATDAAKLFDGHGTALSPAHEPICVAMKPLDGTFAANAMKHGVAGLAIDAARIPTEENLNGGSYGNTTREEDSFFLGKTPGGGGAFTQPAGRWPKNVILSDDDCVADLFPETASGVAVRRHGNQGKGTFPVKIQEGSADSGYGDSGSASRYFKICEADKENSPRCLTCTKASDTIESNPEQRIASWKSILARNAEKSGWSTQATTEFIARSNAMASQNKKLAQNVSVAGSLCDSCATSIAVALVGIKNSVFREPELQVILDCTGVSNSSILIQSLAQFAESWENTDTTPTIESLSKLFGSVRYAIDECTRKASKEKAAHEFGRSRYVYSSKASRAERRGSNHPTVKPLSLIEYLCTLTMTPTGGVCCDPFLGSGTCAEACIRIGRPFIGIELDPGYFDDAVSRVKAALKEDRVQPTLFDLKPEPPKQEELF